VANIIEQQPLILVLPNTPEISIIDLGWRRPARIPDKDADGYSLLNIKNIIVPGPVWGSLLSLCIAMQIEYIDLAECVRQLIPTACPGMLDC